MITSFIFATVATFATQPPVWIKWPWDNVRYYSLEACQAQPGECYSLDKGDGSFYEDPSVLSFENGSFVVDQQLQTDKDSAAQLELMLQLQASAIACGQDAMAYVGVINNLKTTPTPAAELLGVACIQSARDLLLGGAPTEAGVVITGCDLSAYFTASEKQSFLDKIQTCVVTQP